MAIVTKSNRALIKPNQAKRTLDSLSSIRFSGDSAFISNSKDNSPISIPIGAISYLEQILEYLSKGKAIEIVPETKMMTTQQAADYLNVSRPHVVKLMETGALPFVKVGKHRRIDVDALKSFYSIQQKRAKKALEQLAKQSQELDLGY